MLEQLRSNRANLKPPQLQMLELLEAPLAIMQQVTICSCDKEMQRFRYGDEMKSSDPYQV